MQSAGSVVCLVAAACVCLLSLASSSVHSGAAQPQRPRHTLLQLIRAAAAIPPPSLPYSPLQPNNHHTSTYRGDQPYLQPPNEDRQPLYHHRKGLGLIRRPKPSSFDLAPARAHHAKPEFAVKPREEAQEVDAEERPLWNKRSSSNDSLVPQEELDGEELLGTLPQVGASLATNFLRHSRSTARPYDVPQIECPPAEDQMERFPCPSPDRMGRYRCIDDHVLCDGFIDCPDGKDEDREQCMFYKTTKAHLDVIADAIIRFIRGRK